VVVASPAQGGAYLYGARKTRISHISAEHIDCTDACLGRIATEVKTSSSRCSFTAKARKCNLLAASARIWQPIRTPSERRKPGFQPS
jgi:hypothetical protein